MQADLLGGHWAKRDGYLHDLIFRTSDGVEHWLIYLA